MVAGIESNRPRNVDAKRAAAILYGDWGTSKAYVIGLAFAFAGYSSFWLILAMCGLTAVVAINYMVICKHYPDGGGVYASVRHRSEIISIVGAFLLIADYIVTAALSALSAFQYIGVPHPEKFAAVAIAGIGALNWFGPKHTGGLAFVVAIPTAIVVVLLGVLGIPHLADAWHNVQPLSHDWKFNWTSFVSIVLALSGVEAVANSTGVMRLDPGGDSEHKPSVVKTSTPAILWVMAEVVFFTALLGLLMHALPGLDRVTADPNDPTVDLMHPSVNAPGSPGVRDFMLRYMGETFGAQAFHSPAAGHLLGVMVSIVFCVLLLSAVNTAIGALISTQFLMGRDRELPSLFRRLNNWGVPTWGLVVSTLVPLTLVLVVSDLSGLAELYAVGVVGAIATNLGACSTDRKLDLKPWERALMFVTFVVMVVIELSLFIDKPAARTFAVTVLAIGLVMRALGREQAQRGAFLVVLAMVVALFAFGDTAAAVIAVTVLAAGLILRGLLGERAIKREARKAGLAGVAPAGSTVPGMGSTFPGMAEVSGRSKTGDPSLPIGNQDQATGTPMLCAVRGIGKTLDFALEDARESHRPLYLLFVREQPVITSEDRKRKWKEDDDARAIFSYAREKADGAVVLPGYAVSDSPADTIVDFAATIGASRLMLGAPSRIGLVNLLRGNIIRQVSDLLPDDIHLLVYA